jgi:hypothetical protein
LCKRFFFFSFLFFICHFQICMPFSLIMSQRWRISEYFNRLWKFIYPSLYIY